VGVPMGEAEVTNRVPRDERRSTLQVLRSYTVRTFALYTDEMKK